MRVGKKWSYGKTYLITLDRLDKLKDQKVLDNEQAAHYDKHIHFDSMRASDLINVSINDKLIINVHGNKYGIGGGFEDNDLDRLVWKLKRSGLKQAGVIKFHSCNIGEGDWLSTFRKSLVKYGIKFSYLSGPSSKGIRGQYMIGYKVLGFLYSSFTLGKTKVVQGNVINNFKGIRYTQDNIDVFAPKVWRGTDSYV
ncbi:Uncharacterised protein [Cedecea neteri]|uniref:DUF4347 domain-containing protein n=1 Tax=Cedecea neteri TaxID=158822 RepID=A0A291DTL4_9ENTR|nr:hypothetical protein [Cedecea neteri]ATF91073.1 hypothetical protein CO704_02715 [Cedecea neteri]SQA99499.1 Uncharacterised protein [Cedecea neteri]